jgi:putative ABC transport system substrate-binding protein
MKRREFITLLGATAALPFEARAQPPPVRPLIGVLSPLSAASAARNIAGFRAGLRDLGYLEGRNAALEIRYGDGAPGRMAPLAQELVALKPDVLMAGARSGALAAQAATQTIPIIVIVPDDPVVLGVAHSIAKPGGNITGTWFDYDALVGKRMEFSQARDACPRARRGHRKSGRSNRRPHNPATAGSNSRLGGDAGAV